MRRSAIVWGLGRFGGGLGVARELLRRGYRLRVLDRASREELASSLLQLERESGEIPVLPEHPDSLSDAELLCVNPGVPPSHPLLAEAEARGLRRTTELDLFLEAYPGRVLAVTGSNGKSSTSAMLARALEGATGHQALLGGNIGGSLFEARARWHKAQFCVLEISSFQASRLDVSARPFEGLLVTNLATDHLDWHGSVEAYHAAKLRLLDGLADGAAAFGGQAGLQHVDARIAELGDEVLPTLEADGLWVGDTHVLARGALRACGDFQLANARLALALVHALGLDTASAAKGLRGFRGLPHRLARVGTRRGVTFYDNAVSTGLDSTRSALEGLRSKRARVVWVAGGRNKGTELAEFRPLAEMAESVHVFGEVARELSGVLRSDGRANAVHSHSRLREALDAAFAECRAGDTLLLSPGFASFDQYPNFEARARDALSWWHAMREPSAGKAASAGEASTSR